MGLKTKKVLTEMTYKHFRFGTFFITEEDQQRYVELTLFYSIYKMYRAFH